MSEIEINRDCCLFYKSYIEAGEKLKDKDKELQLYKDIFNYGTTHTEPNYDDDPLLDMAWCFIKPLLDANLRNYINGSKGGAPKGNKNAKKTTQNNPKQPVVEKKQGNDTYNVNVNEKDNDNYKDNDKDKYSFSSPAPLKGRSKNKKSLLELEDGEEVEY